MMIHDITAKAGKYKARKRVGRGEGSGHGKQSGRGNKGAGSRSDTGVSRLKPIRREFTVDASVLEDFRRHLGEQKVAHTDEELLEHREVITRVLQEEILPCKKKF